jgi:FkbM family methyltransferase
MHAGARQLVKRYVRPAVRRLGYDLIRFPGANPEHLRGRILAARQVDLVVDVGANIGQYGRRLREGGYTGRILSLEPMRREFDVLADVAAADGRWDAIRAGAGAETGELTIHRAANSISSSFLPMLERHLDVAPKSGYDGDEVVPVERLDVLAADAVARASRPYLKVDTQGYESTVLDGAGGLIDQFVGIELEMSMVPLYGGQLLVLDTLQRLDRLGFRLAGIAPALIDDDTGETLQADGIFLRTHAQEGPGRR